MYTSVLFLEKLLKVNIRLIESLLHYRVHQHFRIVKINFFVSFCYLHHLVKLSFTRPQNESLLIAQIVDISNIQIPNSTSIYPPKSRRSS